MSGSVLGRPGLAWSTVGDVCPETSRRLGGMRSLATPSRGHLHRRRRMRRRPATRRAVPEGASGKPQRRTSALVAPLYPRPSRVQRGFLGGVDGGAVEGGSSWAGPEPGPSPILSVLGVVHAAGVCLCHIGIISDSWVWQATPPATDHPPARAARPACRDDSASPHTALAGPAVPLPRFTLAWHRRHLGGVQPALVRRRVQEVIRAQATPVANSLGVLSGGSSKPDGYQLTDMSDPRIPWEITAADGGVYVVFVVTCTTAGRHHPPLVGSHTGAASADECSVIGPPSDDRGPRSTPGRSARFRRRSWWSCGSRSRCSDLTLCGPWCFGRPTCRTRCRDQTGP